LEALRNDWENPMKKLILMAALLAAPQTPGKYVLDRPTNYREWVFVGSSLGLSYAPGASAMPDMYHNVYIKPEAYREFAKTGKFPEGTMLAMEMTTADTKKDPALRGSFESEFVGLEVAVKDSRRFEGGWGYFSFSDRGSNYKDKAEPFPASAGCVGCHKQHAATDNVFTQFYPVLRAVEKERPSGGH
jgi:hypothetical protein